MPRTIHMIEHDLLEKFLQWLVSFVTALIGGSAVIAVYVWKSEKQDKNVKITKKKILLSLFFGITGAFFIAPMIVEYWNLSGSMATGAGFLSAFAANVILEVIANVMDGIKAEASNIVLKKLKKFFGHDENVENK